tara:strand:- start:475 stop:891 length:417 start_codon:yes stop_codon:yes gene_type:complete
MNNYRVKRPEIYDGLLNELKDPELGVFKTLATALLFAAAYGFKNKTRDVITKAGEPINFSIFDEQQHAVPFIYSLALTEYTDVSYLQEEKFEEMITVFEEYAAGGLRLLDGRLQRANLKVEIEQIMNDEDIFVPDNYL